MLKTQKVSKRKARKTNLIVVPKNKKADLIKSQMVGFMDHALEKVRLSRGRKRINPFNLLSSSVSKISTLERTYSTSAGSVLIQNLAAALANAHLGYAKTNHTVVGEINNERMRRINKVLNDLENTTKKPDFKGELAYILDGKEKTTSTVIIHCDVFTVDKHRGHKREAVECKSPLPNNDQAKAAKEKILKLYSMEDPQVDEAYFVLNYNPYGDSREDYDWSPPLRWFNIREGDSSILIGKEFWNKIGGKGTYELIGRISEEVRNEYEDVVNNEFLSDSDIYIPSPETLYVDILKLREHFNLKYHI